MRIDLAPPPLALSGFMTPVKAHALIRHIVAAIA
jgi:hypothetical protein